MNTQNTIVSIDDNIYQEIFDQTTKVKIKGQTFEWTLACNAATYQQLLNTMGNFYRVLIACKSQDEGIVFFEVRIFGPSIDMELGTTHPDEFKVTVVSEIRGLQTWSHLPESN